MEMRVHSHGIQRLRRAAVEVETHTPTQTGSQIRTTLGHCDGYTEPDIQRQGYIDSGGDRETQETRIDERSTDGRARVFSPYKEPDIQRQGYMDSGGDRETRIVEYSPGRTREEYKR